MFNQKQVINNILKANVCTQFQLDRCLDNGSPSLLVLTSSTSSLAISKNRIYTENHPVCFLL